MVHLSVFLRLKFMILRKMISSLLIAILVFQMLLRWVIRLFSNPFRCLKQNPLVLKIFQNLITMFKKLFRSRKKAQVSDVGCEVQFCAVINEKMQWFNSQKEMFDFIERFGSENIIYKLSMFRHEIHQLKQD